MPRMIKGLKNREQRSNALKYKYATDDERRIMLNNIKEGKDDN